MNVYGLDITPEQGLQMLAGLLKLESRTVKPLYALRAEEQKVELSELLQRELEYIDPQIILCLLVGKDIPPRRKHFQVEVDTGKMRL